MPNSDRSLSNQNSIIKLPRSLGSLETWGFGLTGLLLWISSAPGAHAQLGPQAIVVWLPGIIIGMMINFQVKKLGEHWPDLAGGTPNYITRLLKNQPLLGLYAAIGYYISWVAVLPANAIVITDFLKTNLDPLGFTVPETISRIFFTIIAFIVAFSGTRALGILHLFFVVPAVGFLLVFCVQGLGWLTFSPASPGLFPSTWPQFDLGGWGEWYIIAVYAVYACETASAFVADSKEPQQTLRVLNLAAWLIPPVYLGGSWLLMRLATEQGLGDNAFLNLLAASKPFWGDFAPILVTFLVISGSLLSCATAAANSPRMLYQLSLDGLISPVFSVTSRQGVLGPSLVLTLILSLLFLLWGDLARIVFVTGIGWLFSFITLHWGLWLKRGRPEVLWPRWSLFFAIFEIIALIVGGISWNWQDLLIGLILPIGVLIGDRVMRRFPFAPFHRLWWEELDHRRQGQVPPDFMMIQVLILIFLVSSTTIIIWVARGVLDGLGNQNVIPNIFVLLLLTISFVEVAIAGWTSLPQVAAIEEARERSEHLFKIAIDAIIVVNDRGIIVRVNPATEELFNTSDLALLQQPLHHLFPLLSPQPEFWPNRSEHTLNLESETRIIEIAVSSRFDDSFREFMVILRDITTAKKAQEKLKIAEKNYRGIFENALEGIFQATIEGKFISMNPAMARIYGYNSPQEMIEKITDIPSQLYVNPSEKEEFERLMELEGQVIDFEYQSYRQDGSILWTQMGARVVRDRQGQVLYYEGIVQDISDQKRQKEILEIMVQERTSELAQANAKILGLNDKLKEENLRMGAELDVARQIQMMILPKPEELENIEELDIAGYMEPAAEVGGDYYDVLYTDGVVTIGIGDVTGHGLESGILMLMTQTAVRTLQEIREVNPVIFLDTLNQTIYKNVQRMNSDKSLSLAIVNYVDRHISISGQHEEILVIRHGGQVERIDTIDLGFPIGLDSQITDFISHTLLELGTGDGFVLYTDGITEAENMDHVQYGLGQLCTIISQNWSKTAAQIKDAVITDLRKHIGAQKVFDDITLVVLKQK